VFLRPVPGSFQAPAVDDLTGEIETLALGLLEETEEYGHLTTAGAEVDIGNPDRTVWCRRRFDLHDSPTFHRKEN